MSRGRHQKRRRANGRKLALLCAVVITAIIAVIVCIVLLGGEDSSEPPEGDIQEPTVEDNDNTENDTPDEDPEPEKEPESGDEPEQEQEVYDGPVNPLTGLPVDEDISDQRPYAIMINNIKVATPQAGIGYADIIYETLAEGGLTRLLAVYQDVSDVETIGSVRSARPYFIDLAQGHDAIYIHAGGSDDAYTELKNRSVAHIDGVNGSGETFFRDSWRKANMGYEHSLMLDTTLLDAYNEKYKLRTEHNDSYECNMVFSDSPSHPGESAENVKVVYSSAKSTSFAFDAESKSYKVSQYGAAMKDSSTGEQVTVKNIIVLYASITQIPGDSAGRMRAVLTGSGSGYFICNGVCSEITWSKDSYTSQFVYKFSDGTAVEFGRGTTYISIIPSSGGSVSIA
ncbi:MAG: DUF3048 domain-containing protein [Oscillospiraceae bacterium]